MLTSHLLVVAMSTNVLVPMALVAWRAFTPRRAAFALPGPGPASLLLVGTVWFWHVPAILSAALSSAALMASLHATVLLAALLFWHAVLDAAERRPWRALAGLLVAMKSFGLLGVLLVLAPRSLYRTGPIAAEDGVAQADQNLAGLAFMSITAAGFFIAAVAIVARLMARLQREPGWTGGMR